MLIYQPPKAARTIPVIDINAAFEGNLDDRKKIAWEIHKACRETGFFYIKNHRVPEAMIAGQFKWAKTFFDLPLGDKMAIDMKKSRTTAGYEPMGAQKLDSQDAKAEAAPPDLKESFYCGMDLADDHELAKAGTRTFGHNQWPEELPEFRTHMNAYWQVMTGLGHRVLSLVALSLDLPESWFASYFDPPSATLRLLKYPPHPGDALANQLGAGAHTDWGTITLLAQDSLGGLEVRNANAEWVEASPVPGTFVINLGDMMSRWTNGLYNSTMHRVKNNHSGHDRYSVPFFFNARPDAVIEPIPGCVTADRPQLFPACTALEHLAEMFRRSYGFGLKDNAA
jgi:isopenicillin N synthase-like dioxygenase